MDNEEILHRTARMLVRRARWVRARALLLNALFVGLCLCVALAIWHRFAPLPIGRLVEVGLALMALSIMVAVVIGLRSRAEPMGLLIRADRTLKLKERLSTAYELLQSSSPHPLRSIVLQEGARVARSINPFRVVPTTTPRTLRWTPFLLLALVLVLMVDFSGVLPTALVGRDEGSHPEVLEQGQKLERLGKRLETEARQRGLERSLEAARRMQNIGQRLQHEKINEREAVARVNSLTEYMRNLEDELRKMAVLEDVSLGKVREVMVNQASVTGEVQRLLGMLSRGKLSAGEMRHLQERAQNLQQQGGLDERLSEALSQLREGDLEGAKELLENFMLQDQLAQDFEHLKRAERSLERGFEPSPEMGDEMDFDYPSGESEAYDDDDMAGDVRRGSGGGDPGDFEGGDYLDAEGTGSTSSIGTGRGTDTESRRSRVAETNAPATKIPGQSGEGGVRRTYVRALPLKADPAIPLEEVLTTYQRRAEESLLREEIPPRNREIVKAYFLSIGLVEESGGSEGKDEQRER
jgi:hypothetical protein